MASQLPRACPALLEGLWSRPVPPGIGGGRGPGHSALSAAGALEIREGDGGDGKRATAALYCVFGVLFFNVLLGLLAPDLYLGAVFGPAVLLAGVLVSVFV